MPEILAIDIGGTKVGFARVDNEGQVVRQLQVPTKATSGEDLFALLVSSAKPLLEVGPVVGCGVDCGGPMTTEGELVSPLNIPQWRDFPLRSRLENYLEVPVVVDNDAKALALGEGWVGAAVNCANYIAMVVSTGIGGGIVLNGELLDGATGNAGHIGHLVVDPEGNRCPCGSKGCLEALVSGTALARDLGYAPKDAPNHVKRRCGKLVGRAVGMVVNLLDLRLAIVGGSVALGFGDLFFDSAQHEIDKTCGLEFTKDVQIVPASLGSKSPLVGAAAVWWKKAGVI